MDGDEDWKLKYENLMAEVREYKKEVQGTELTPLEKMDEEKIHAARAAARRFMPCWSIFQTLTAPCGPMRRRRWFRCDG